MTVAQENDPRSKERFQWIKKYREVDPVYLAPPEIQNPSLKSASGVHSVTGIKTYNGNWGEKQARHLLSRTMFGVKKAELDRFKNISMEEAVDALLQPSPIPNPPVNDYQGLDGDSDPYVGLGESWIDTPHARNKEGLRVVSLKNWLIKNMLNQETSIHEKMMLFWSNLLVTKVWDVYAAKSSYQYYKMIYENALGNYKTFIKKLTVDPSMLNFLNGGKNTKDAPDENYARELQELFCVGKGPGSEYTETDVQEAARVLTGWRIKGGAYDSNDQYTTFFDHFSHDKANKQFSGFYDNFVIEGKSQGAGASELDDLLDMIFSNEETSKYICRRIYSFFVYNEIPEEVEQNVIVPLAEIFRNKDFELLPVLNALFKSEHFYDDSNIGALIKSPADHLLGVWRTLEVTTPDDGDLVKDYQKHRAMLWHMSSRGMEIGDPPNVAGWTPYYQAPQFDKAWITTTTITKRAVTTDSLLFWGFWISQDRKIVADIIGFVQTLDDPDKPILMLREAAMLLLGIEVSDTVINHLKTVLLSGQLSDSYWTKAWYDYMANPDSNTKKGVVESRLKSTFQRLFQLAEFQLM